MKVLYLLRHAKSSWEHAGLADHDRPLAARGRKAAEHIAAHLRRSDLAPDLVLCSSARRTRETLERLGLDHAEVLVEEALYGAAATELLERVRAVPDTVGSVLLVGHNPAVQQLTLTLAGSGTARGRVSAKFPTGALASLTAPVRRWADLASGTATLVEFVVPRELE